MPAARYITLQEAAETLGVTDQTLRKWIAAGTLRAYRLGTKAIRLNEDDVLAKLQPIGH